MSSRRDLGIAFAAVFLLATVAAASEPESFHTEETRFRNGEVELAGTLLLPVSAGPHPGIVCLQGSGPHAREASRPWAEQLARLGLVVLIYDKRGTGDSGGDWTRSSLDDLAGDAVAALGHLSSQPGVDPDRVGLWAPSQGAWVATKAAGKSKRIAFAIFLSGGGASPREVESYGYRRAFEREGLGEGSWAEARALLDRYFDYLGTGRGREGLEEALESARERSWYRLMALDRILPSPEYRERWEWVASYDPLPGIAGIRFPVLLLFGELDEQQPTPLAVARWREGLAAAANPDVTVEVLAGADHFLRAAAAGHPDAASHGAGGAPPVAGLWETIAGWLTARGLGGAPVGPSPVPPHSSPYAGQERLEIPALTSAELDGLRTGAGLGLARAAELNHYPGPRHVLELAGQLALSAAQRARVEAIHGGMHDEAVRIGREIVEREATLDRRFAHRHIDDASLRELTAEIARLWGELRYTHLAAHLLTRAVLSDEQVAAYDRLRGYGAGGGHEHRAGEH